MSGTHASSANSTVVLDASAALRLLLHQSSGVAERLRRSRAVAPELIVFEVTNVLATSVRAGRISAEQADRVLEDFLDLGIDLVPGAEVAPTALTLAVEIGMSAYDAAYLALAATHDAVLLTADRRLASLAPMAERVD